MTLKNAGGKTPKTTTLRADSREENTQRLLKLSTEFTVVCLDLSVILGHDLLLDGIALVRSLEQVYASSVRCIIVKSRSMSMFSKQFCNVQRLLQGAPAVEKGFNYPRVLCTVGVKQYRESMAVALRSSEDSVLEIGCHYGMTTHQLCNKTCGAVVGVDVSKKIIATAQTKFPQVRFEVADAWNTEQLLALQINFEVIFLDVGGVSGHDGLLESIALVRQLLRIFQSSLHTLVVKSKCLRDHAGRYAECVP